MMRTYKDLSGCNKQNICKRGQRVAHSYFKNFVFTRIETGHFTVNPDQRASVEVEGSDRHTVFQRTKPGVRERSALERPMQKGEWVSHTRTKWELLRS